MNFYELNQLINKDSSDTVEGSFRSDLIASKNWLCKELKKHIIKKPVIYVLGSWYGNIIVSLKQFEIDYKKIYFVEIDKDKLKKTKKLFGTDNLVFLNKDANEINFKNADVVINTSSNEMQKHWLQNVPDNKLVLIQARHPATKPIVSTSKIEIFDKKFPLGKTLYLGEKSFEYSDIKYTRFMKIGHK
jgi:shikimate 5-dehydrogenase